VAGVLEGIRVLDFGRYIAGPYCATLLADFGAEVIRVEKVEGSEDRFYAPISQAGDCGATYMQMGRNKRGVTLNPRTDEGRKIVRQLVATADVVVANLPPQTLTSMCLDYETLRKIKPDIILTTNSAFGSGGPYSERVGFDGIGQAMSGAMYLSGWPDQPQKIYPPYVDFGTALYSALGTMAALMERNTTGKGCKVETSLFGTAISFNNAALIEQATMKLNRVGTGNRGQVGAPIDAFKTKDGWILIQVIGQPLYERWVHLIGENCWLDDDKFGTDEKRGENRDEICERTQTWCAERSTEDCLSLLAAARIPSGPVLTPEGAINDKHVNAMKFLKPLDYPGLETPAPVSPLPIKYSKATGTKNADELETPFSRPPKLGEHTDEILAGLGYKPEAIKLLRDKGVI
jgi:crotonobetainyl-CoA:carnitine CoA-transferase CaiB-like acyl-CoA transferase